MHIDPLVALAGLIVGAVVGLTGMGGGALMTPILVIIFGVHPLAAVSSDLVASMVMKPLGSMVHMRRGTVVRRLVGWLMVGSVPGAFSGVFLIRLMGRGPLMENQLQFALGAALLLAAAAIVTKGLVQVRRSRSSKASGAGQIEVHRAATVAAGAVGGLLVGMTSVGSGSLIVVMLMFLYPGLSAAQLVGTDLVQAVPLVSAAAVGHLLYGDFQLGLTVSLLIGSLPGVYLGARLSAQAPDMVIRPALVLVLLASGLKLVGVGTVELAVIVTLVAAVGLPVLGAVDATSWSHNVWHRSGQSRRFWVSLQAASAVIVGIGAITTVFYFLTARPRLAAAVEELTPAPAGNSKGRGSSPAQPTRRRAPGARPHR